MPGAALVGVAGDVVVVVVGAAVVVVGAAVVVVGAAVVVVGAVVVVVGAAVVVVGVAEFEHAPARTPIPPSTQTANKMPDFDIGVS